MENYRYNPINASNKSSLEIEMEDIAIQRIEPQNKDFNHIKIIMVGDVAGKSAFCRRYTQNRFSEFYKSTIGVDFASKEIVYDDNKKIMVQFWDICSSEIYESKHLIFYQESNAAIILFDIWRPNLSFDCALRWMEDIRSQVKTSENNPIPCLLIGNKCDLVSEIPHEIQEQIDNLISTNQIIGFFKTSCLNGTNVKESVEFIVNYIIENNIGPSFVDLEQINDDQQEPDLEQINTCICKIC